MNKMIMSFVLLLAPVLLWATEPSKIVKVKGMVCAFCVQGVEKKFKERAEVEKVEVSLTEHEIRLYYKKGQKLDDKVIEKLVKEAGLVLL